MGGVGDGLGLGAIKDALPWETDPERLNVPATPEAESCAPFQPSPYESVIERWQEATGATSRLPLKGAPALRALLPHCRTQLTSDAHDPAATVTCMVTTGGGGAGGGGCSGGNGGRAGGGIMSGGPGGGTEGGGVSWPGFL